MLPEGPQPLWSTEQLAEYLGIAVPTVHSLRRRGDAPPAYRVGKVLRFDPAEVTAWLHERREDPTELEGTDGPRDVDTVEDASEEVRHG